MSTVEEIEAAIAQLPEKQVRALTARLIARQEDAWDRQIEADAVSGRLDALWDEAKKEIEAAETESLDEFLRNQDLPK